MSIGAYTAAVVAAILCAVKGDADMARATGFLLHVGIFSSAPAAVVGFIDWKQMPEHTPAWKTGLIHMIVTGIATVIFILVSHFNQDTFGKGLMPRPILTAILVAYALMGFGGWLGGKIVFVFGYRVLAAEAASRKP